MLAKAGINVATAKCAITPIGIGEIIFGILVIAFNRQKWPWLLTAIALLGMTLGVAISSPLQITAAFNPITLDFSVIALAIIGYLTISGLPTSKNCLRKQALSDSNRENQ